MLTDTIGHRLSGSPQLDQAIQWALAEMKRDGLENVHTEKVMVPKWVRGNESADIVQPARLPLAMLGLGGSVATPRDGMEAPLLVVRSYEELEAHGANARGRIVLFNVPFTSYGETSRYRWNGASRAARHGARRDAHPIGRPERPASAPHGRAHVRRRRAAHSGGRDQHARMPTGCNA